ncbi:MAG: DUF389 domain-containing protein [Paludibacteraceae bacterium]|nr:DUF389 domain-containing protein [Paludibacteraceae bacterium]
MKEVKAFLSEYLQLSDYLDVEAAVHNIRQNVPFRGPTVYILFVAVIIASVGLNVNSIPVIIGAMLISPLMGPIIGLGLSLGINDRRLLVSSLRNLAIMFFVSLLAATLYFWITPLETDNPTELMARTNPSIYDVLIAFFGGLAGVLEISRRDKGTVMSGVAIATALMPPLCTVGYGIANRNIVYAGGALYLFFINLAFIALAAYLTSRVLRFPMVDDQKGLTKQRVVTSCLLLALLIVSTFSGYNIVRQNAFVKSARHFVRDNQSTGKTYIFDYSTDTRTKPYTVTLRLAGEALSEESRQQLCRAAEAYGIMSKQLIFKDDATIHFEHLDDKQIMRDWMASQEKQLRRRDDTIRVLTERLEAYERNAIDASQLLAEITAQYPQIDKAIFAKGSEVKNNVEKEMTVVLITAHEPLTADESNRLQQFLAVRLKTDAIQLRIEN